MTLNLHRSCEPAAAPEQVRCQLDKLLASHWFARSERMRRFLRFGVERALAGTGNEIKEYLVGVEVYDRAANYDPQVDPIVRVEARRLRAKLDAYYASAGKDDAVVIKFPKGAYTATFLAPAEPRPAKPVETALSRISVLRFTSLSREPEYDSFGVGLTEELILQLTRVRGLQVLADTQPDLKAGALLRGSWRRTGVRVRVTAQLIDTSSGAYVWSEVFERSVENLVASQEEIAREIVDAVRLRLAITQAAALDVIFAAPLNGFTDAQAPQRPDCRAS